jgi:hypothetical protein
VDEGRVIAAIPVGLAVGGGAIALYESVRARLEGGRSPAEVSGGGGAGP